MFLSPQAAFFSTTSAIGDDGVIGNTKLADINLTEALATAVQPSKQKVFSDIFYVDISFQNKYAIKLLCKNT